MRALADENIHGQLVEWLRASGVDTLWACESCRGWPDSRLLDLAAVEGRVIVTDDKDFGDLIFNRRQAAFGVLLIRLTAPSWTVRLARLQQLWPILSRECPGRMVVVTDERVRIRPLPLQ